MTDAKRKPVRKKASPREPAPPVPVSYLRRHPATIGYVILVVAMAASLFLIRQESQARKAFDDRRAYELCLSANEGRQDINERFDRLDKLLVSFGDPDSPEAKRFLASEKAAALKPRKCELQPQNATGPQR